MGRDVFRTVQAIVHGAVPTSHKHITELLYPHVTTGHNSKIVSNRCSMMYRLFAHKKSSPTSLSDRHILSQTFTEVADQTIGFWTGIYKKIHNVLTSSRSAVTLTNPTSRLPRSLFILPEKSGRCKDRQVCTWQMTNNAADRQQLSTDEAAGGLQRVDNVAV